MKTTTSTRNWLVVFVCLFVGGAAARAGDSLPPLVTGKAPQDLDELWGNYDPRNDMWPS
jgi:hypothetical protein